MHALTKRLEKLIGELIKSGRFANKSEVVRAGLRLLEDSERDTASAGRYIGDMPKAHVRGEKPEPKRGEETPTRKRLVKGKDGRTYFTGGKPVNSDIVRKLLEDFP
jgi:putative addiction module CopG family antidote